MRSTLPVVVIVGRPNVGKSTLFNRLVRKRVAVVEDTPGITRDRLYAETEWNGRRFQVVDTGGIVFQEEDPLSEQIRVQANVALEEADVVLFVTDTIDGVNPDDQDLANRLRPIDKPVLVVVNKADNPQRDDFANEFYRLGLGDVYPVSGLHGRGVGDLMDVVVELLPPSSEKRDEREEIRVAIIGRPNVGKSSLVNAFTGQQRMIVSSIAGTTRDAIDTELEYNGEKFRLIDTAGIRRRGKIQGSVEYYMVDRAQKAVDKADCALIVVDGSEGLTDGDKRIMKLAHDAGRACVFAVNKWDTQEPPDGEPRKPSIMKKDFLRVISNEIPELAYATAAFTSAKESAGLEPVLDEILKAQEAYSFRVSTGQLNRLIQDATFARPYTSKGRALKIYYATQVSTRPPTFVLFVNEPDLLHFSYERYLLNKIRETFPLAGTPIRIRTKSSHGNPQTAPKGTRRPKTVKTPEKSST
jgi:GTP-binding protein